MGASKNAEQEKKDGRRRKADSQGGSSRYNSTVFVNVHLTKGEKEALKQSKLEETALLALAEDAVMNGYRLSITVDKKTGSPMVVMSGVTDECVNKGYTLTSRASTVERALLVCIYKLERILPTVWSEYVEEMDDVMD